MRLLSSKASLDHIFRVSVLLGRIMTMHSHLHISRECAEYKAEFENLENIVRFFCFSLSRGSPEDRGIASNESNFSLWLNSMVQKCNIFLYHPMASQSSPNDPNEGAGSSHGYPRCLEAARLILDITKEAASNSPEALANPFLITEYFLCCRFLSIAWQDDKKQSDRDDIDFILLLVNRVSERWAPLAKKFRKGIMRDLAKGAEETRRMRVGTGCYLDMECV